MNWRDLARCKGQTDLFFIPGGAVAREAQAKAICADCPVQSPCLEYAISKGDTLIGIWAGTNAQERRTIRRRRQKRARAHRRSQEAVAAS